MKINLKLRFKNKATLAAIIATAILLAQQLGLKLPENINDVAIPNVVITSFLYILSNVLVTAVEIRNAPAIT